MNKLAPGFIFLLLCVFILTGCAGLSKKDKQAASSAVLEPQAIAKFADIPVPAGFTQIPKDSYSFENSGVRVAVLRYQGKADVNEVVSFYKEQMLMYNWDLLNVIEYGDSIMNFDRESESCIITLSPKGSGVTVTISLGPKSQVYKKSKELVVK